MEKKKFWIGLTCLMVFGALIFSVVVVVKSKNVVGGGLPIMEIKLNDVTLVDINENSKDIKYVGNSIKMLDNEWSDVEIKGRGNFTWGDVKKPYRIKFKEGVDLLGLGKSRKWALLTNNLDDSLMRNDLGFYLVSLVGSEFSYSGEFVRLVVDDEDLGVYYLTNGVSIDKNSVNLRDEYGVLMELDNAYCDKGEETYWSEAGNCLVLKDVVNKDNSGVVTENFLTQFNELENAAKIGDYLVADEVADMESLAKYFLVSEFLGNPDAYVTSFFFYKKDLNGKIYCGPVWDLDGAFGNLNWGLGTMEEDFFSPWMMMVRKKHAYGWQYYDKEHDEVIEMEPDDKISKMMYNLAEIPEFMELVRNIYENNLASKKDEIMAYVDERVALIRNDAISDAILWEKNDFDDAVLYLKWWVEQRFRLFDAWSSERVIIMPVDNWY